MADKKKTMSGACYGCKYRTTIPGDAHSQCLNVGAAVRGNDHGIKSGWFMWPWNFDPTWLISCNGFKKREENK